MTKMSGQALWEERWFSVLFLLVCCVTRLNVFKSLYRQDNRVYHQYAQYITNPWFLLPETLAMTLSIFVHTGDPIRPVIPYVDIVVYVLMAVNVPALASAFYSKALLHLFYVVSPARSGIIKQTYGSESAGDRVKKGIVYIHLVVALVAQALWCASIVFSIQEDPLQLKVQVFACAALAIILQRLVLAGFNRDNKPKTSVNSREKATTSPSPGAAKTGRVRASKKTKSVDSALHSNIKKKGKHSYYYAHASTREEDLNRGEPPKRLEVLDSEDRADTVLSPRNNLKAIRSYYFVDKRNSVKIYIKEQDCIDMEHELKWTATSLRVTFGAKLVLHFPKLFKEIRNAQVKKLENKVVIILEKDNAEISWTRLN